MSIQLSGAVPVDFTFNSGGTRAELVTTFQTQLTTAGWTVVSGGGSGDVILQSATTPQGVNIRVEAIDSGSGNCAQFKIRDAGSIVGPTTFFLLPVSGSSFRIWADKYQFFYYLRGTDMTKQRSLVCGGTPWIPPFIQAATLSSYMGWLHGNGTTDTDTNPLTNSFRHASLAGNIKGYSALWNGTAFGSNTLALFGLLCQTGLTILDDLWEDGTFTLFEPILIWQAAGYAGPVRYGQMWDAALTTKPLDSDIQRVFGGITWRNVTHQNTTNPGRGCIMLVIPT